MSDTEEYSESLQIQRKFWGGIEGKSFSLWNHTYLSLQYASFQETWKKKTVLEQKEMDSKHFVLFLYGYLYAGNVEYWKLLIFQRFNFCNFNEITLRQGRSPVNLMHIFRTPFLKNTSGLLLLPLDKSTTRSFYSSLFHTLVSRNVSIYWLHYNFHLIYIYINI